MWMSVCLSLHMLCVFLHVCVCLSMHLCILVCPCASIHLTVCPWWFPTRITARLDSMLVSLHCLSSQSACVIGFDTDKDVFWFEIRVDDLAFRVQVVQPFKNLFCQQEKAGLDQLQIWQASQNNMLFSTQTFHLLIPPKFAAWFCQLCKFSGFVCGKFPSLRIAYSS